MFFFVKQHHHFGVNAANKTKIYQCLSAVAYVNSRCVLIMKCIMEITMWGCAQQWESTMTLI